MAGRGGDYGALVRRRRAYKRHSSRDSSRPRGRGLRWLAGSERNPRMAAGTRDVLCLAVRARISSGLASAVVNAHLRSQEGSRRRSIEDAAQEANTANALQQHKQFEMMSKGQSFCFLAKICLPEKAYCK